MPTDKEPKNHAAFATELKSKDGKHTVLISFRGEEEAVIVVDGTEIPPENWRKPYRFLRKICENIERTVDDDVMGAYLGCGNDSLRQYASRLNEQVSASFGIPRIISRRNGVGYLLNKREYQISRGHNAGGDAEPSERRIRGYYLEKVHSLRPFSPLDISPLYPRRGG